MAQMIQVLLVDDLDGGTAQETVTFALDGVSYEIDLSAENAAQLRESLSRLVASARRVGGRSDRPLVRPREHRASSAPASDAWHVRQWAMENGLPVSERGRIPAQVLAAYAAAREAGLVAGNDQGEVAAVAGGGVVAADRAVVDDARP